MIKDQFLLFTIKTIWVGVTSLIFGRGVRLKPPKPLPIFYNPERMIFRSLFMFLSNLAPKSF